MANNQTTKRQTKNAKQRRKTKKTANRQFIVVGISLAALLLCITTIFPKVMGYWESQQKYRQIQTQYETALNEQAALEIELKKAQDPNYIQQYAREKYFLSNPGEILLVLPDPPKQQTEETKPSLLDQLFGFFSDTDETE